ncbi:MAG: SUMF1/EgtB/PvdO family nonheme iron enzyme [Gammaproteobacteria bacterium]
MIGGPFEAAGTTDPVPTGSRSDCVSDVGVFDMVENLVEWVADWVPRSTGCGSWDAFSDDDQCLAGAATDGVPGALVRGGVFSSGSFAGVFNLNGNQEPNSAGGHIGFRAAR